MGPPPDKVNVIVAASVTYDSASALYTYAYTVTNLSSSRQKLRTIYVEAAPATRTERPDSTWYARMLSPFLEKELHVASGWAWSQTSGELGIAPGQTVTGFRIVSSQPPAVVRCFSAGRTPNMAPREEPPDELRAAISSVSWRFPSGFTIGPASASAEGSPAAELNTLTAAIDEAERQGWLGAVGSARSVRSSLQAVRAAVTAGNGAAAAAQIQAMLVALRGASAASLSSEARALLQYQLQRLENKLRVRKQ